MYSFNRINHTIWIILLLMVGQVIDAQESTLSIQLSPLNNHEECTDNFVAHDLDHITEVDSAPVGFYKSNGAGLAINDLDNDGDLDIVLANFDGDNAIFWNLGDLQFDKETLPSASPARAVAIVDVDGDNWLDIVFTQQEIAPLFWRNQEGSHFKTEILRGVTYIAYAMTWADLDNDGDLDLITGSYDAEVEKILGQNSQNVGVIYYENQGDRFVPTRLADQANTLAILIDDINSDGQADIIVGNDFAVEDQYFTLGTDGWETIDTVDVMPHSTMSYDSADINNNGQIELYATDMMPYAEDEKTMEAWEPIMEMMMGMPHVEGDPQIMENVLFAIDEAGNIQNYATELAIDRAGWSWSAKFGDLDNDGFQDLYVVNGMISHEMFSHLPNNELVEENQVFRNLNGEQFEPYTQWGLNATESGRGMSMADLDNDGDLDIVINNLLENSVVYENRVCGGDNIQVDLLWQSVSNTRAIGTKLILHTNMGVYKRVIKASSGYLSGDPSRVHIGFPSDAMIDYLLVDWSDGTQSKIEDLSENTLVSIIRD